MMPSVTLTCGETGFKVSNSDLSETDLSGLIQLGDVCFKCDGNTIVFDPDDPACETIVSCSCGEEVTIDDHGIAEFKTLH